MYKESEEEKYARILQFLAAEYTHLDNEYEIFILDGTVTALSDLVIFRRVNGLQKDIGSGFISCLFKFEPSCSY